MAKLVISFVIGLAVAALGLNLLNREPTSAFSEQSSTTPSRRSVEASDASTDDNSPNVTPKVVATDSGAGEVEESREIEEAVDERSADARSPPELPIYLPPEFDWLAGDGNTHDLVQREPYDVNWAPVMEANLSKFLSDNPEFVQTYGYPISTVCRTSMCELLFVGRGLETKLDDEYLEYSLLRHFTDSIADSEFFGRPEFEQFRYPFNESNLIFLRHEHTANGVTSIAWWLRSQDRVNHPGGAFAMTEERLKSLEERRKAANPSATPTSR